MCRLAGSDSLCRLLFPLFPVRAFVKVCNDCCRLEEGSSPLFSLGIWQRNQSERIPEERIVAALSKRWRVSIVWRWDKSGEGG